MNESSSASLRSATVWGEEKCIVRCAIGEESRRAFIPSTLLLHKNGKKVGIIEEESGGSIAYEFIPWEEENKKLNKQNIKKPILFHCSAEIFPDEAKLLRKGRRHFPQITNKNENESTPLEYFYNKEDDPFDNKSLTIKDNQQQQQNNYLLPISPIPSITSPSLSRIPRLYSTPQIKRTTKEIEKEEINFEEEKHSNSSNNQSSESGGEYDNLQKLCEEIQRQKNVLETKRMECKQNNNGGSAYMNLILLGKGENEN
uniref:Uncharacterized protein n=1 Tax=Meloidogyne javanica TaxID=6303 RepID=A0A915LDR0_MELJA